MLNPLTPAMALETAMNTTSADTPALGSVRPLVRYVDEDQAVLEVNFHVRPPVADRRRATPRRVEVQLHVRSTDGFNDEERYVVTLQRGVGTVRMHLVSPQLWWPVGMGQQALYDLDLQLIHHDRISDAWSHTVGLSSVRPRDGGTLTPASLMINGQECRISELLPIDAPDEQSFLPIGGQSLVVVRGHYGPDVLYGAADRAGILMLQCVPIDPNGRPEQALDAEVDRLAPHPCLAGWYVGHLGPAAKKIARRLRQLDPTHGVFTDMPPLPAA